MAWKVVVICKSGTKIEYDEAAILDGGIEFTEKIASENSFALGACISKECNLRISDSTADANDYYYAEINVLQDNVSQGIYVCYAPELKSGILTLSCYDAMIYTNRTVNKKLSGKTFGAIAQVVCSECGLELANPDFAGSGRGCTMPADTGEMTYRDILSYIAQATAHYVKLNAAGQVYFGWYDTSQIQIYGGFFDDGTPYYKSGETISGGTFTYTDGDDAAGGEFADMAKYTIISDAFSLDVGTDEIVVTGVNVKNDKEEYLAGTEGYVISVDDNVFTEGKEESTAKYIASRCVGMSFRTFSATIPEALTIKTGYTVYIMDAFMNVYKGYVTSVTYTVHGMTQISCDAAAPVRQEMKGTSVVTKLLTKAASNTERKIKTYDATVQNMTSLISQGFGLYTTTVTDDSGAVKQYLHDKPALEDSTIIWTRTAEGLMVSKDGRISWAIDSNGNALFNVLTAHGINADWVHIGGQGNGDGQLIVKNAAGDTIVLINNAGITMADGTSLINDSGVCGDLTFSSGGTPLDLGWAGNVVIDAGNMVKREVFLQAMIPENYVITSATLVLSTCGTAWENIMDAGSSGSSPSYSSCSGYSRGIKAYVGKGQVYKSASWDGEYTYASSGSFEQIISGGFTSDGVNGTSSTTPKQIKSGDIKDVLSSGLNTIKFTVSDYTGTTNRSYAIRTGSATALLTVKGYTKN
ncbi:MAG: hypothetical protein PUA92_09545 [Clostridium sp.]|nr:hypothetical protein [Clostridium sp.]